MEEALTRRARGYERVVPQFHLEEDRRARVLHLARFIGAVARRHKELRGHRQRRERIIVLAEHPQCVRAASQGLGLE